jgi:hypothetical protein
LFFLYFKNRINHPNGTINFEGRGNYGNEMIQISMLKSNNQTINNTGNNNSRNKSAYEKICQESSAMFITKNEENIPIDEVSDGVYKGPIL